MKLTSAKKTKAKIEAREWIVAAIQNHQVAVDKQAEREIKRFIGRIQRDLKSLKRAEREADLVIQAGKDYADSRMRFEYAIGSSKEVPGTPF